MGMQRYSYEEMMLLRIIELNSLMPHHYTELFMLSMQLLSPEEREELKEKMFDVEKMVLETEMVQRPLEDGKVVWVEKVKGRLSLYDIEMAIESNPDYYAYFEKEDGTRITKFDVERELNKIKAWIYDKVREKSTGRRFQRFR